MVDDKEMASAEGNRGVVSEAGNQSLSMVKIVGWGWWECCAGSGR